MKLVTFVQLLWWMGVSSISQGCSRRLARDARIPLVAKTGVLVYSPSRERRGEPSPVRGDKVWGSHCGQPSIRGERAAAHHFPHADVLSFAADQRRACAAPFS